MSGIVVVPGLSHKGNLCTQYGVPGGITPLYRLKTRRQQTTQKSMLTIRCMSESAWISGDPSMASSPSGTDGNTVTTCATTSGATMSPSSRMAGTMVGLSGVMSSVSANKSSVADVDQDNPNGPGKPPTEGNDGGSGGGDGGKSNGLTGMLMFLLRGIRSRIQADPHFGHKLAVECGLDTAIIVGVNYNKRRERFLPELEFTLCQLAISLLSDFALVYLLAPSSIRSPVVSTGWRSMFSTALPAHLMQRGAFTPLERLGTLAVKGVQYGSVGFAMGCLGATSVRGLIILREHFDPNFVSPETVQSCYGTGKAWGGFMAVNSNIRYNLVNAAEDAMYHYGSRIGKLSSVALRLGNNWLGAAQWLALTDGLDLNIPWKSTRSEQAT